MLQHTKAQTSSRGTTKGEPNSDINNYLAGFVFNNQESIYISNEFTLGLRMDDYNSSPLIKTILEY